MVIGVAVTVVFGAVDVTFFAVTVLVPVVEVVKIVLIRFEVLILVTVTVGGGGGHEVLEGVPFRVEHDIT